MNKTIRALAVLALAVGAAGVAQAQDQTPDYNVNVVKLGLTRYDTHAKTNGVQGLGVPAGADATTSDATTVVFIYERMVSPNIGVELVLGKPPTIKGYAAGSVDYLGKVVEADSVAPTLLFNYHFGEPSDKFRPYLGLGINYTHFSNRKSPYGWKIHMENSWGPAAEAGFSYKFDKTWGMFASVAVLKVKSELVGEGAAVIKTTIDYRPVVYTAGVSYSF
ncbi:OmpW/AlkL family protein [Rubrivivax gelatinosus]|uniref:OmpW family protein n=1 Tax=Rubrivivax gelatinosus (strain NBRC 100245 / IL144) TaxID=983917 RepID=I0HLD1_RUBGI|nr:OmpW family outer membrane protein [Rubrivivax gelatinosus]MBG6080434.1 outer membrane protein [Rubrivivax gelatinosus]BAL93818.1 OmpW family protein [Rubrivivax gelatinosus IL144]